MVSLSIPCTETKGISTVDEVSFSTDKGVCSSVPQEQETNMGREARL